jgi:endonuclease-3 related protein
MNFHLPFLHENMNKIYKIYTLLLNQYGLQGWWPLLNYDDSLEIVYHKGKYDFPRDKNECFEVCLGSILTQNTTFASVVKALHNLSSINCLSSSAIKNMDIEEFKQAIRPAGYFNQKSKYILEFIKFYDNLNGKIPKRDELLGVLGIGEETADSILLYGYNQDEFKVDAYTKRLFTHLGIIDEKFKYKDIKALVENSIENIVEDKEQRRIVYQEYHALIVEHAKHFYAKKPYGNNCFLKDF